MLDLFTATPLEEKMRFRAARHGSVNQGYFPIEETSDIHPDLVEGWVWCRRAFDMPQERDAPFRPEDFWPRRRIRAAIPPAGARPRGAVQADRPGDVPGARRAIRTLYDAKLTGPISGCAANYYPPMSAAQDRSGAGRLLGHEDVDLFTILPATARRGPAGVEPSQPRLGADAARRRARSSSTPATTCSGSPTTCCPRPPTASASRATARICAEARVSFPIAVYVWEDELLEVLPGPGRAQIRAGQGDRLPHPQHEQILRRRLCGGERLTAQL